MWFALAALTALTALAVGCSDASSSPASAPSVNTTALTGAPPTPAPSDASSSATAKPEPPPEPWLEKTLREADPELAGWLRDAPSLRLQLLVAVLDPKTKTLTRHAFRPDAEYFYPASAIKLPLAVVALAAMNERLDGPVHRMTRLMRCRYDKSGCEPPPEDEDRERDRDEDGKYKHKKLRVGQEIQKMLSYSDNDSYNRLWDIVGHRDANERAASLGLSSVRFHHRMNAPADKSVDTQRVTLLPPAGRAVVVDKRHSDLTLAATPVPGLDIGKGWNAGGKLVELPLSFAQKNYVSLAELQRILLSIVLPEHPEALKLPLDDDQRQLLIGAMTAKLESKKNAAEHHPLSPGVLEVLDPKTARYVGKSGRAYGFHLENAYIENVTTGRAAFIAVTVYANPNEILNDDDYGYDDLSKPLLAKLGRVLTRAVLTDDATPTTAPQGMRQR